MGSGLRPVVWRTEVAIRLTLETSDVPSPPRRTRRYPNAYWRHFHLVGTEPFEMADHFAGPRRRTENVQALGRRGRPAWSAGSFLGYPRQGFGSDGNYLSDRRHSGSRARRVLDPPGSGAGRDREPRG